MKGMAAALVLLCAGFMGDARLAAHHNAWAPDRTKSVTIEGDVEIYLFSGPHAEIRLRTADGTLYIAEWQTTGYLAAHGVTADTLERGDHVIVRGSPYKNPDVRKVTLLAEVRRPADGWRWLSTQYK